MVGYHAKGAGMIADIASNNTGAADVLFLIALIIAVLAALLTAIKSSVSVYATPLAYLAVGGIAFGLMLL